MEKFIEIIKKIWIDYDYCLNQKLLIQLRELTKTLENNKEKDNSTTLKKIKKLIKNLEKNNKVENVEYKLRELDIKLQDLPKVEDHKTLTETRNNITSNLQKLISEISKLSDEQRKQVKGLLERENDNLLYVAAYHNKFSPRILYNFIDAFHKYELEKKKHFYTKEGILHYIIQLDDTDAFKEFWNSYYTKKKNLFFILKDHELTNLTKDNIKNSYNIFYYAAEIGSLKIVQHLLSIRSNIDRKKPITTMLSKTTTESNINPIKKEDLLLDEHSLIEIKGKNDEIETVVIQDLEKNYPNSLDIAIQNGNFEIVREILSNANYDKHITLHTESIYIAADKNFKDILKIIGIKKKKINFERNINNLVMCIIGEAISKSIEKPIPILDTKFQEAAKEQNTRVIENLMTLLEADKKGVLITKNVMNKNLLHYAISECNLPIIETLSKNTTLIVEQYDNNKDTSLHLCYNLIQGTNSNLKTVLEIIKILTKKCPEVLHIKNKHGKSPLMLFASNHVIINAICHIVKENIANKQQKVYLRLHEVSEQIINTQNLITGRILSLATACIILSYLITINITGKLQKSNYILGCLALTLSLIIIAINSHLVEKKRVYNLLKEYGLLISVLKIEKEENTENEENNSLYQLLENNIPEESSSTLFLFDYRRTNKICSVIKEPTNLSNADKKMYVRLSKVSEQLTNTKKISTVRILSISIALIIVAYLVIEKPRKLQKRDYILVCVAMALSLTILTIDSYLIKKKREYNVSEEYEFLINKIIEQKENIPSTKVESSSYSTSKLEQKETTIF